MHTRTVFINGTVGVGKTTTAEALGALLEQHDIPHALIDADAIHLRWPAPKDDSFDCALELANLRALCTNYRAAGCAIIIVAGVIEELSRVEDYKAATAAQGEDEFLLVRLTAPLNVLDARLMRRHENEKEREWHRRRAPELDGILRRAGLPESVVDATQPLRQVAKAIFQLL